MPKETRFRMGGACCGDASDTPSDGQVSLKCDMFWIFKIESGDGEATPQRGPGTGSQKEDCEGSDSTGRATCSNARR